MFCFKSISNEKIQKARRLGKKDQAFWLSHKAKKKNTRTVLEPVDFPTYYNIDFNCAKILYCANYLKFIYQYCDVKDIDPIITRIDYFGNISPKAVLTVGKSNNDFVILENDRLIASVEYLPKV